MATPRKRPTNSGFTAKKVEQTAEENEIKELLDEVATEMFETISQKEEPAPEPEPYVPMDIVPTDDVGPRFVEPDPQPTVVEQETTPQPLQPVAPRRHPRNVPKFSRYK